MSFPFLSFHGQLYSAIGCLHKTSTLPPLSLCTGMVGHSSIATSWLIVVLEWLKLFEWWLKSAKVRKEKAGKLLFSREERKRVGRGQQVIWGKRWSFFPFFQLSFYSPIPVTGILWGPWWVERMPSMVQFILIASICFLRIEIKQIYIEQRTRVWLKTLSFLFSSRIQEFYSFYPSSSLQIQESRKL